MNSVEVTRRVVVHSGFKFSSVLGIVFIVLKLTGVIAWSWWLVLLPFYWTLAIIVFVVAVLALVGLLVEAWMYLFG